MVKAVLLTVSILALVPLCLGVKVLGSNISDNDADRPSLPQNMYDKLGAWECVPNGTICPPTAQGIMQGWYQFDDSGQILLYREGTLYYNSNSTGPLLLPYLRTYSDHTNATEYSLEDTLESTLSCTTYQYGIKIFSREFLQSANYIGKTKVPGPLGREDTAYTFQAQWILRGRPVEVTAWVLVRRPDMVYGVGDAYSRTFWYNYIDVGPNGFGPETFLQPEGITCSAA